MKANVNLNVLRKEVKEQTGTYFYCVGILYNVVENCPSLKAILPKSKTKAKEPQFEDGCKEFVKFGKTLTRKVAKTINGEKSAQSYIHTLICCNRMDDRASRTVAMSIHCLPISAQ